VQQLGVESLILSAAGGALGLFAGWAGSRVLVTLSENAVQFGQISAVGLDGRVFVFTVALALFTTVLFGLFPAWYASKVDLQSSIKRQGRGSGRGGPVRARSFLVVAEVAIAVVLLFGGGLLLRSFVKLSDVRLGFIPENVLTMRTLIMGEAGFRANLANSILERVEALPGVRAAGTIQFLPLGGMTNNGPFRFVGRPSPADPASMESDVSTVSRGYFAAIGMEVLRGRDFGRQDRMDGPRVALVNEGFVNKYSRDEDPIGRVIIGDWANPKPTQIIGVVNDIRHNGLAIEPRPTVFLAQAQVPGYFTNLVVRTSLDTGTMAAAIRREVRQVDPKQPLTDIQPMEHYVASQLARPKLYSHFVGTFAGLALFLAAVGLYGLLAFEVGQRRHEIGLRMALGANPRDVVSSTMWKGLRLVIAGAVLGTLLAFALGSAVSKFLFGVRASDPWTYVGVCGLLGAAAVAATVLPALRAARVDPVVALRYE
jgi:predicted permease